MLISRRIFLSGMIGTVAFSSIATSMPAMAQENATSLINAIRKEHGLGLLSVDAQLTKMAQHQAELMASKKKIGHSLGWGNGFVARLKKFNIHGAAAENVASGQPSESAVMKAWMNSPGHRKNMLDKEFTKFGFARASNPEKPNYYYWAIVFGV